MLYISIFCIFCRFFCLLTIKIFFPQNERRVQYKKKCARIKKTSVKKNNSPRYICKSKQLNCWLLKHVIDIAFAHRQII